MSLKSTTSRIFKKISIIGALPILAFAIVSLQKEETSLKIGAKMPYPTKKMVNVDQTKLSLSDLKQKNGLIVVFSCNTCPFVVGNDDFPGWEGQYNELHTLAQQNEIGFVLLNSNEAKRDNEDSFTAMVEQAKSKFYSMPYLVDKQSVLANAFGAKTTPHVYVFNGQDKLVFKGSIDNTWDSKRAADDHYLKNAIDFLAGKAELAQDSSVPRGCSIKRVQ